VEDDLVLPWASTTRGGQGRRECPPYVVRGDGRVLYESHVIRAMVRTQPVFVAITGVREARVTGDGWGQRDFLRRSLLDRAEASIGLG